MSRIAYVNGAYVPLMDAAVHIEDRGYQFSDGVYEGIAVRRGKMVDLEPHITRLKRSLAALQIAIPVGEAALKVILRQVIQKNHVSDAFLYIQVTRGVAKREHYFPNFSIPSLVVTCRRADYDAARTRAQNGVKAFSHADNRWPRVDIKAISLLPNILAKQAAKEKAA